MTVTFMTEFATPRRKHGDDIEVVYDPENNRVVEAVYSATARPVMGKSRRFLEARLAEAIDLVGGWSSFQQECIRPQNRFVATNASEMQLAQ